MPRGPIVSSGAIVIVGAGGGAVSVGTRLGVALGVEAAVAGASTVVTGAAPLAAGSAEACGVSVVSENTPPPPPVPLPGCPKLGVTVGVEVLLVQAAINNGNTNGNIHTHLRRIYQYSLHPP